MHDLYSGVRYLLAGSERAAVSFSGGLDSTLLLKIISEVLPGRCVGVFVDSPLMSERQRRAAHDIADALGFDIVVKRIEWEDMPGVADNGGMRCYHCKRSVYKAVRTVADSMSIDLCLDGENASDMYRDRPGRMAAREFGIRSPFAELGISRKDVISEVDRLGIRIVKDTCMATRIPADVPLTEDSLRLVEYAESVVRRISGIGQVRVRIDGNDAVIQTAHDEIPVLLEHEGDVIEELGRCGLKAAVDMNGYNG